MFVIVTKGAEKAGFKGGLTLIEAKFAGGLGSSWSSLILGDETKLLLLVLVLPLDSFVVEANGVRVIGIGPLTVADKGALFLLLLLLPAKGPEKAYLLIFLALTLG